MEFGWGLFSAPARVFSVLLMRGHYNDVLDMCRKALLVKQPCLNMDII